MQWQRFLAIVFCWALLGGAPAHASNVTDHWWTPSESGWGMSVTQQGDTAFIVFFVYGADGKPLWLHGTATRYGFDMERNPGFAGPLYRTTGPWFGGSFDPQDVRATPVGEVVFEAHGSDEAAVKYTVDGIVTTRTVQRLTFRVRDWSGLYRGVLRANYRGCAADFIPPYTYDDGLVDIEHVGNSFRMWIDGKKAACMYTGTYTQHGRIGEVAGTYQCADGPSGTFRLSGLETTERTFGARLQTSHPSCSAAAVDVAGMSLGGD